MANNGAIINLAEYAAAAADRATERFAGCFPRNIRFGDIDSFLEINHHFLIVEWKRGDQSVKQGQFQALSRLSRLPRVTVYIIWQAEGRIVTHGQRLGHHQHRVRTDFATVYKRFAEWGRTADAATVSTDKLTESAIADYLEAISEIDALRTKAMMMLVSELRSR